MSLYPPIEPSEQGLLDVGDSNQVYWETSGNPDGKPAVFVHGGPGWACRPQRRQYFDPDRYRIILFDQRGCGRSTPHASDPAVDLRHNTTEHLLADLERLRVHLGVRRWLMFGGSWGSTLQLAYALRHPDRVSELVIAGVTTSRPAETDWLYLGLRRFFPAAWAEFAAEVSATEADSVEDLIAAYSARLADPDPQVRERAATAWCTWEDATLFPEPGAFLACSPRERLALVRLCAHYFANRAWLPDNLILDNAHRLAGIPGVLIHGRLDLTSPLETAWRLAAAWPDAELVLIEDAGHSGSDTTLAQIINALDRFA